MSKEKTVPENPYLNWQKIYERGIVHIFSVGSLEETTQTKQVSLEETETVAL